MDQINKYFETIVDKPILKVANSSISLTDILYVVLIICIAYLVHIVAKVFLNIQIKRKKIRSSQGKSLLQLFGYVVTLTTIFAIAGTLGYSLSYVLVGSTALLVGLGFGLQQLFLDVVSGVILLIDKDVNLGDVVRVDIPGSKENMYGKIFHVGLRATLLQNIDNEFLIIPNSRFLSSGVRSLMRDKGSARFRVTVQVGFDQDMEKATGVLMNAVLKNKNVDKEPQPTIIIKEFGESGITLEVRFWMKELFNSEIILSEVRFQILSDFAENGINIPYPHRVLKSPNGEVVI